MISLPVRSAAVSIVRFLTVARIHPQQISVYTLDNACGPSCRLHPYTEDE